MRWYCSECSDEFYPVEYVTPDEIGPNFCSTECEDEFLDAEEFTEVYLSAGLGASVFD